jgi:N-acetylglucosamine-6-phosphate deacetylase
MPALGSGMATFLITRVRLVRPGEGIEPGGVVVRDGRIDGWVDDAVLTAATRGGTAVVDGGGALLTPGLIDIHSHGIARFSYEAGAEALRSAGLELGRFGVTTVLPTVVPRIDAAGLLAVARVSEALPAVPGVDMPGLHLEGPFVALGGAACATLRGDVVLLDELLAAAQGRTRAMSISPETPGILPVIERLVERGIRPFVTHTRATVEQTLAAIDAGATHATHFYDVFPAPPEVDPGVRPAGVVETMLADPRATVDFIADGVHVHPMAIRAAVAAKGWRGVTLITDSNIGAGLPPGLHDTPWGYPVRVRDGDGARHAELGFLAGSALTMNRGMANLLRWLDRPAAEVWAMGTLNPARLLGLSGKGCLQLGAPADLVLWDADCSPRQTWLAGRCTYTREPYSGGPAGQGGRGSQDENGWGPQRGCGG